MLNPISFDTFIGQTKVKSNLKVCVESANTLAYPLDHVLLCGPPGLGKTTLAEIIAEELQVRISKFMGPQLDKIDKLSFLHCQNSYSVVFIDEIHALPRKVEEALYEPLERFTFENQKVRPFTLIGATTREGYLTKPLHDRFTIVETLIPYTQEELATVVKNSATKLSITITADAALEVAKRSRGVPRQANQLLKRISYYDRNINTVIAQNALDKIGINNLGLDDLDKRILNTIYKNGPVGIDALSNILGEDRETIESTREPYLVRQEYIRRTERGRCITDKGKIAMAR